MPGKPTLEEVLLRKASSIGAQKLPKVTESAMPLSPGGVMGAQKALDIFGRWLNPARGGPSLMNVMDEAGKMGAIEGAGNLWRNRKRVTDAANKGIDWVLGYDPNAVPVGNPKPAGKK